MIRCSMWASQCLRSSILSWNLILYHTREQLIHMVGPANGIAGAVLALNQAVVLEPWQSWWKLFQGVVRHDMVGRWSSLFHFEIDILESGAVLASPFFPCIPFELISMSISSYFIYFGPCAGWCKCRMYPRSCVRHIACHSGETLCYQVLDGTSDCSGRSDAWRFQWS